MNPSTNKPRSLSPLSVAVALSIASLGLVAATTASAQQAAVPDAATSGASPPAADTSTTTLDTVSVLGSRSNKARTVVSSAVPIDIISTEEFRSQGATDALDQLRTLVPSFNVSVAPIDDGATFVRPANLRGLPPDNTLLLINEKRFHRAAVITFTGHGLSDGAQGPDLSVFPSLALEQVEVLRDGAAAQYGSDAIAGVINYRLKELREGGSAEVFAGQNYKGDGTTTRYSAQLGLPLTERGFATLTAEWGKAEGTSRSVQQAAAREATDAGYPGLPDPAQQFGSPRLDSDLKVTANLGLKTDAADFYLFGNYARRELLSQFYYRNPTSRSGVYSNDGGKSLLVGDLRDGAAGACPSIALQDPAGALRPYSQVSGEVSALPEHCFTFLAGMPSGFRPQFGGELKDAAVVAGAKGTLGEWYWDVSGSWGQNDIDFTLYNSINPSLGPDQPEDRTFHPGGNRQTEKSFNVDVNRDFDTSFTSGPLSLAVGAEWREESFQVRGGDLASTAIGPLSGQGFAVGSNGFNGFNDRTAGTFSQRNWAAYVDLEGQVTDRLQAAIALRREDFNTFGSTNTGKLSTRFDINDRFALRGAFNTGFRAPTPGQANVSQIVTNFDGNRLVDMATLPAKNAVASLKGARPLTPEKSQSLSLGAVWNSGNWVVTLDGYRIKVDDRLALSKNFALTDAERAGLVSAGHTEALSISSVNYFGNAFDTTTSGVDLVATYRIPQWGGTTTYSLAANWNQTKVNGYDADFINAARVYKFEHSLPKTKGYLSINHQRQVFHANLRLNYYGSWYEDHLDSGIISAADGGLPIYGGSALLVDADIGWNLPSGMYISVGGNNLFNKTPAANPWASFSGATYPTRSPYGFTGGFYYARFGWKF